MRPLMVQGCSSDAGKSYLVAGLCRLYARRGLRVMPFKGQNMSNNAGVGRGGEMGRAQLLQSRAAGVPPDVRMNPVLVKPEGDGRSQVVVQGTPDVGVSSLPWQERKVRLWKVVRDALHELMEEADLVLIEGAGSPAEINLRAGDIANMRVAREAGAAVLLAADIDRGGAFAHLLGTWSCLEPEERSLLAGFVLNRFRGDPSLLAGGPAWLERRTNVPTVGVVPHLPLPLPAEDALSLERAPREPGRGELRVAAVRLPTISNFDELDPLQHAEGVHVRWVEHPDDLQGAHLIVLPGSKAVVHDLDWLRQTGLADAIVDAARGGTRVLGICGGMQMLGRRIEDPDGVEGRGGAAGLGLLDLSTRLEREKVVREATATLVVTGERVSGYEIHAGRTVAGPAAVPLLDGGLGHRQGNVLGVYLHGLLASRAFRRIVLGAPETPGASEDEDQAWDGVVEAALDELADHLEEHLDMPAIDRRLTAPAGDSARLTPTGAQPSLYLFTGGARSGKSHHAQALARRLGGDAVTVIATLEAKDEEMTERIAAHQAERPPTWSTVEAPTDVPAAIRRAEHPVVLLDCLSGWVANLLGEDGGSEAAERAVGEVIAAHRARGGTLIVVTNEVGSGVVPAHPLGRRFRDVLGRANQELASAADAVALVTVGIPIMLKGSLPEPQVAADDA